MDSLDSKPLTYSNDIARLPAALSPLCAMPNWVVWRWTKNGSGKWTKPPFQSQIPSRLARNNVVATWSAHAAAVEAVKNGEGDGVGFVLTGTDIVAIDLDHCRDPAAGEIDPWAQAVIDQAAGSYVEITVSGTGLRVIGRGAGAETHTNYKIEGQDAPRSKFTAAQCATLLFQASRLAAAPCCRKSTP
jgi:primase-polymerase (primpol)-like protein